MMNLWELQGWLYEALFTLVPHRRLVEDVADWVSQEGGEVLDAGCGTGRLGLAASVGVDGVDFSKSMLLTARRRNRRVAWVDLDQTMPIQDSAYDQVVSLNVLYALPRPGFTVQELARVLRPGGRLILATPTSDRLWPLVLQHLRQASPREMMVSILNLPRFALWLLNLAVRGQYDSSQFTFLSQSQLVDMVRDAGLTVETVGRCYAGIDCMIIARKGA